MKKIILIILFILSCQILFSQDLSVPVTIHSDGASLKDVCEYLSQQTKLNIKAGKDESEWLVYDRKSVIHVENVALKDLMISISNVFDLTWVSDDNGTIYLTFNDEQKNRELKLREDYFRNTKEVFTNKQKNTYDSIINKTSQSEFASIFYKSKYYSSIIDLFNSFPKLKNYFLEKKSIKIDYNKLTEEQKNVIKTLAYSYIDFFAKIQPDLSQKVDIFQNENISIEVNSLFGDVDTDIENDSTFSKILIKTEKQTLEIVIFNPDGKYTSYITNALMKSEKGVKQETINNDLTVDVLKFKTEMILEKQIPCENLSDEIFNNSYNLYEITNRNGMSYNEVFKVINDISSVNIVADYYYRANYEVENKPIVLKTLLQDLSNLYELKIVYNNGILECQDKYYYIKVASIVPMAWIDYWVVRAYENQGYTIEDLIKMSQLNDLQIDLEIRFNPDLNKVENKEFRLSTLEVVTKRNILRFLASLDENLLKKCYNSSISAYDLSDEQWELLQNGIEDLNAFYVQEKKSSQSISLRREVGNVVSYKLTYSNDISSEPIEITILSNKLTIKNKNKE